MDIKIKMRIKLLFAAFFCLLNLNSKGQNVDSIRQKHINYFSKKLGVTNSKATQIATINENYKSAVKTVMSDHALNDKDRRTKIDQLITIKNKQLALILTADQVAQIIPTTERKKQTATVNQDSLIRQKQVHYLSRSLSIDEKKAAQVALIQDSYKKEIKNVSEAILPEPVKAAKINGLIAEKNKKLSTILTSAQLDRIIPERRKISSYPPLDMKRNKEIAAVQDSFEYQSRKILADKKLNEQAKNDEIGRLELERNKNLMKAYARIATATAKDTTKR